MRTYTLERKTSTKTRFMSLVLALTMACTMVIAAPGVAFAGITDASTIVVNPNILNATLETTAGQTLLVGGIPNADGSPGNFVTDLVEDPNDPGTVFGTDWTVAYLLNVAASEDPTAATVNKRTGLLTATAQGIVAVDVWLVDGLIDQSLGVPDNAVGTPATIFINIGQNNGTYGAQGNSQTVLMNTINGTAFTTLIARFSGNSTDGFLNILNPLTPVDDNLAFNFTMAAGTGPDFDEFVAFNAGNIQLFTSDAAGVTDEEVAMLETDNTGILFFDEADPMSNTVTLNIDIADLDPGTYLLRFAPGFRGNNPARTLAVNVDFVFSI